MNKEDFQTAARRYEMLLAKKKNKELLRKLDMLEKQNVKNLKTRIKDDEEHR
jgi:hypothetical protein